VPQWLASVLLKSPSLPLDGFLLVGPRFNSVNSHLVRLPPIGLFNKLFAMVDCLFSVSPISTCRRLVLH